MRTFSEKCSVSLRDQCWIHQGSSGPDPTNGVTRRANHGLDLSLGNLEMGETYDIQLHSCLNSK